MIDVKPFLETIENKPVAVLGLAKSGLSVIKALKKAGANKIYGWDDKEEGREEGKKAGAQVEDLTTGILKNCGALIVSPGVPLYHPQPHPVIVKAREVHLDILGDIEIFYRCAGNRTIIALTGTNGKSTTTSLITHILEENGIKTVLAGNIGLPVLDMKLPAKGGVIVLELSSFQLDLCRDFSPDIGVLLNVTPDHIDRHGNVDIYSDVKSRVFNGDGLGAVISIDDDYCRKIYNSLKESSSRKLVSVTLANDQKASVQVRGGVLYDSMQSEEPQEIGSLNNITMLHGPHNKQNAASAYAVIRLLGVEPEKILEAMKTFEGLPHRQYPVRVINGVAYINDSKATNAEAAGKALACNNNIYWILGGKPKEGGLNGLEVYADLIKHAFLIGEASNSFADWLDQYGIEYTKSGALDIAVRQAHEKAQSNRGQPGGAGVVLLSPACASYDQFKSFEHRGDVFTKLVGDISDEEAA